MDELWTILMRELKPFDLVIVFLSVDLERSCLKLPTLHKATYELKDSQDRLPVDRPVERRSKPGLVRRPTFRRPRNYIPTSNQHPILSFRLFQHTHTHSSCSNRSSDVMSKETGWAPGNLSWQYHGVHFRFANFRSSRKRKYANLVVGS